MLTEGRRQSSRRSRVGGRRSTRRSPSGGERARRRGRAPHRDKGPKGLRRDSGEARAGAAAAGREPGLDESAIASCSIAGVQELRAQDRALIAAEPVSRRGLTAQSSTFDRRDVVRRSRPARGRAQACRRSRRSRMRFLGRGEVVTLAAGAGAHVQRADVIRRADGWTSQRSPMLRATRRLSCWQRAERYRGSLARQAEGLWRR